MLGCSGETGGDAAAREAIHVALGKDLRKGKVVLHWVLKNLRSKEVVVIHVHKPPTLIPMKMGGKFPIHMATQEEAERYSAAKRAKMNALLHSYMCLCASEKIPAKKLVIEADDVYKGIVYLVGQHQIKGLVMGLRSIKGLSVLEEGLLSCNIWLVYNGRLMFTREALMQQISIEFTGDESQGKLANQHRQISISTSSPKSSKESSGSHQDNDTSTTSRSWSMNSSEESIGHCSETKEIEAGSFKGAEEIKVSSSKEPEEREMGSSKKIEEIGVGSSKEDFEAEDLRDLLEKLTEAVHIVYQQRLELARQMFVLKQEFIEFSLPELEEATSQFITKAKVVEEEDNWSTQSVGSRAANNA